MADIGIINNSSGVFSELQVQKGSMGPKKPFDFLVSFVLNLRKRNRLAINDRTPRKTFFDCSLLNTKTPVFGVKQLLKGHTKNFEHV